MLGGIFGNKGQKIKGNLVLMRKNVLDINSITNPANVVDTVFDIFGSAIDTVTAFAASISVQLISSTKTDGNNSLTRLHLILGFHYVQLHTNYNISYNRYYKNDTMIKFTY